MNGVIFLVIVLALNVPGLIVIARTPRCPRCNGRFWSRRAAPAVPGYGWPRLYRCLSCEFHGDPDAGLYEGS